MYKGRRVFRAGRGMILSFVVVTALFASGAFVTYRDRGWGWDSIGLACATVVFGLGSILESLVLRIQLTDEALIVTDLTGRRRYDIADIDGIEEARGVVPVIRLKNGRWVKLPSVGSSVGNSVRSWLKHHSAAERSSS